MYPPVAPWLKASVTPCGLKIQYKKVWKTGNQSHAGYVGPVTDKTHMEVACWLLVCQVLLFIIIIKHPSHLSWGASRNIPALK